MVVACLWWVASCGGGSSVQTPAGQTQAQAPAPTPVDATGLPSFPVESGPRSASANGSSITVLGKDFLQDGFSTVDGNSLVIGPSGDQEGSNTAYGLYKFTGVAGQSLTSLVVDALPGGPDMNYYIGLADYTHLKWKWLGPVSLPEFEYDFSGDSTHYISPLGNVYMIVATHHLDVTTHNSSTLNFSAGDGGGGHDPGAPTELAASDGTFTDHVGLTWNAGDGAQFYEIYRHRVGDDPTQPEWSKIGESTTTEFSDTAVTPGQNYYYEVRSGNTDADNVKHFSAFSNVDSGYAGTNAGGGNPGAPTNLVATDGTFTDHVGISWTAGDGADYYEVWRYAGVQGEGWILIGTTEHTEFSDTDVTAGHVYYYKARSAKKGDNGAVLFSDYSNADSGYAGSIDHGNPGAPTNLVASDGTYADHVGITWTAGDGATSYEVYRYSDVAGVGWVLIGTTEHNTYSDTDVSPGKQYYYRARSRKSDGAGGYLYSDYSNIDSGYASGGSAPTYSISGTINDGFRAGTTVTLLGKSAEAYTVQLSDGGNFKFDGLPAGNYLVFPYNTNYQFTDEYWNGSIGADNPDQMLTFTGGPVVNPNRAWGFVWQLSSDPTENGWVPIGTGLKAWLDGTQDYHTGQTNDAGFYGIPELPQGTIIVQPVSDHYAFTPSSNHMTVDGTHLPTPLLFVGVAK